MAVEPRPEKKSSCGKILLGCAIGLVVICGGGITIVWIAFPKVVDWFKTEVAKAQEWEAFAQNWNPPPSDADPEQLFPNQVAGFDRQDIDKDPAPQIGIHLAGAEATYQKGAETMEVFAYRANIAEKNDAFQRLEKMQQNEPNKWSFKVETATNTRFAFTRGQEHGVLWWSQGWLFLVRTTGSTDPEEFLKSYLTAIADKGHARPKPAKPPKPEKPAKDGGDF